MDNSKIFDTLERRIEKLLARLRALEQENDRLRGDLGVARKSEKDAADARGAVERMERDQQTVRDRLEKLLHALEATEAK